MKFISPLLALLLLGIVFIAGGCDRSGGGPKELLDKYFSSAIKQDYAATYTCYYAEYRKKINEDEYVRHRKEASILQSYEIISLKQEGDTAQAEVLLTFGPSEILNRKEPSSITVKEDLIKENGEWKIRVW